MKYAGEYYLGLDMGTSSVGWAVTTPTYEVVKRGGKALWGVRLFDEAKTAADRRLQRTARRRLERRAKRLDLLQELFAEEIAKVDMAFFQRLNDSAFYEEDKSITQRNSLFNDIDFDDKSYHKKYPTIYHLRHALMTEDRAFDVRLVYLAIHHIIKHRGHFLYDGLSLSEEGIPSFEDLFTVFQETMGNLEFPKEIDKEEFADTLKNAGLTIRDKAAGLIKTVNGAAKDKRVKELMTLLAGGTVKLSAIFADPSLAEMEHDKISFSDAGYDDYADEIMGVLGDRGDLIQAAKGLYDWAKLVKLLGDAHTLSEAKVKLYEQHRDDLKRLKRLLKPYPDVYAAMFKKMGKTNYSAYVGLCKEKKQKLPKEKIVGKEDFYKTVKKAIGDLPDSSDKTTVLQRIDTGDFMPKSVSTDNSVVPYQLHLMELKKILGKAEAYLPFLQEKDEYGTVSDKIIKLMEFKVPYYVGPLNKNAANYWAVRKKGQVYPWNFEQMVDLEKSAENFISNLTGKCTYLIGKDVLPKNSLLYAKFTVLNALNNIRLGASREKLDALKPGLKMRIYEGLFLQKKNVTKKALVNYLQSEGIAKEICEDISGMDDTFTDSLAPWIDMTRILGEGFDVPTAEAILKDINVFAADKPMLEKRLHRLCPQLDKKKLKDLMKIPAKGWGRLSKEFLTDIYSEKHVDLESGEVMNIITALEKGNQNLMELLAVGEGYKEAIDKANADLLPDTSISYETIEQMYLSPAVKRPLWQTLRIVKEITKILGKPPTRIFIEMAKSPDEKKQKTKSRKEALIELYKNCKEDENVLFANLEKETNETLRNNNLYLYYTQLGRCMYSGHPITLEELKNQDLYDKDHIYPRSLTGDDSLLNNLVLVEKVVNDDKGNIYPLAERLNGYHNLERGITITDVQKERRAFWRYLLQRGLINKEKYSRLVRNTPLSNEEKAAFIGRHLVETRQSTKAAAEILKRAYPDTDIVYAKARNASQFRQFAGFIKVRDLNDYHHAKDAYLNVVVGNVFYTKFTTNPMNFLKEKSPVYSLNPKALYGEDSRVIARGGKTAWTPGEDGTMAVVRKWMGKNNILFTRMSFIGKGGLFDQNVMKKGKGQVPLKENSAMADISKYGGYNKASAAYFVLLKVADKKGKVGFHLDTVPIHFMDRLEDDKAKKSYFQARLGEGKTPLNVLAVVLPRIPIQALFSINGFRVHLAAKNGATFALRNATQLCIAEEDANALKRILKFNERHKKNNTLKINKYDGITEKAALQLYHVFLGKLKETTYQKKLSKQTGELTKGIPLFERKPLEEKCSILGEILHLFQCNAAPADLTKIGGGAEVGKLTQAANLKKMDRVTWIVQSVTGFFETKIPLWQGDE